jgi:hypothetical protein
MVGHKKSLNPTSKEVKDSNIDGLIHLISGRVELSMDQNCVIGVPESLGN